MLRTSLSVIEVVRVVIKVVGGPSEMVAVNNGCAVGDVGVVVIDQISPRLPIQRRCPCSEFRFTAAITAGGSEHER